MQGTEDADDFEEFDDETFRAVPHPDDRLWRHPSEIAAAQARSAANTLADTVKIPAVDIGGGHAPLRRARGRAHAGVYVAAGVVLIGAAALTLGVAGIRSSNIGTASTLIGAEPLAAPVVTTAGATIPTENVAFGSPAAAAEASVAQRLQDEVAPSLPRIQAATASGMREGSGLFITDEGHIVTSAGLIEEATYVLAWTDDGGRWVASVLASDRFSDVALLQIDSDDWPAVDFGSDDTPWSGQYAFAFDHETDTIEVGEVTAIEPAYVVVDQPAALPGSAIIDDSGAVIGMVTGDGSNQHATPAWLIEKVAVAQITSGSVQHPTLGIVAGDAPDGRRAVVVEVGPGSPAGVAGLRVGDLIDSINGEPIDGAVALWREVHSSEPDAEMVLTVTRNGHRRIIVATPE